MVTTRNTNVDNSKKKRKKPDISSDSCTNDLDHSKKRKHSILSDGDISDSEEETSRMDEEIDLEEESDQEEDLDVDESITSEIECEFDNFIEEDEKMEEELDEGEDSDTEEESEYDPNNIEDYERKKKNGNSTIIFFLSGNNEALPKSFMRTFDPNLEESNNILSDAEPEAILNLKKRKHLKSPKKPIKRIKTNIKTPVKTLDDLIKLTEDYPNKPNLEYSFNIDQAKALKSPLEELKNMIGLESLKEQIVDQVMFLLSGLRDSNQMLHTVITGSPGCGKTTCGVILSKIYQALGYSNGKFRIVKRSDLIGEYLGSTAAKTQRVIDSVRGGVLFIDEAYSLGNQGGNDSFSKEAIDTLNQNLSMDDEKKGEFICIIAGYKKELDSCFFSMNPGLSRRFTFRYEINEYTADQLYNIYLKKLELSGWSCDPIPASLFEKHYKSFKNKGGDMEILSQKAKIAYSRRIFGYHQKKQKHLLLDDVEEGLRLFLVNEKTKSNKDTIFEDHIRPTMFV